MFAVMLMIEQDFDFAPIVFMVLAILGLFFGLAVGSLAGYHWWLARFVSRHYQYQSKLMNE